MLAVEARMPRVLIGRLDQGDDVIEALTKICREHRIETGLVRASGCLGRVALGEYDPVRKNYVTSFDSDGTVSLLSLDGNVSFMGDDLVVNAFAVCSWTDRGQNRLIGGRLQTGEVITVEFSVISLDDVRLIRGYDKPTGLPLWQRVVKKTVTAPTTAAAAAPRKEISSVIPESETVRTPPAPSRSPSAVAPIQPPEEEEKEALPDLAAASKIYESPSTAGTAVPPGGAWEEAIARSQQLEEEANWEEGREVKRGDVLLHPRFGRCKVLRTEDEERAIIRNEKGHRAALSLSVMRLIYQGEDESGHQIFRVKPRRWR